MWVFVDKVEASITVEAAEAIAACFTGIFLEMDSQVIFFVMQILVKIYPILVELLR